MLTVIRRGHDSTLGWQLPALLLVSPFHADTRSARLGCLQPATWRVGTVGPAFRVRRAFPVL